MTVKRALITGITGQDGSYLAEFLLDKGYEVIGFVRSSSTDTYERIEHLADRITIIGGDMVDSGSLMRAIKTAQPHEIYNLASQSYVYASFGQPAETAEVTAVGVARILDALREIDPSIRFYQASSSEMFGSNSFESQNENTPFAPCSPYAIAKVFGHLFTQHYRQAYDMYAVSGILFNHESPRRGIRFVTRKVTDGVARIKHGQAETLQLGNMAAQRDWGYAGDYVRAMWMMLQQDEPRDYVIATGESHSVEELCQVAFAQAGLDYRDHVRVDPKYFRPSDVPFLRGDPSRARAEIGWEPTVGFHDLVAMMVEADLARVAHGRPVLTPS
ncbi:MAG: GDP-mannose 4,6-dehydratase [Chloroflexota bacterium]|nr:GDP-mannose 4,6-dehydratase [Chloroflexota bacterium]